MSSQVPSYDLLISTDELQRLRETAQSNPEAVDLVIIDCRWSYQGADVGKKNYFEEHIPGAYYVQLEHELSAPKTPATGRHPLITADEFKGLIDNLGIRVGSTQVVVYEATPTAADARMWWMLRVMAGHHNVAILDGGFPKWKKEGRPTTNEIPAARPKVDNKALQIDDSQILILDQIKNAIVNPEASKAVVVDSRTEMRHQGKNEPFDSPPGRIPNTKVHFFASCYEPDSLTFKSKEQLKKQFEAAFLPPSATSAENVWLYCGSGVTACVNMVGLELLGLKGTKIYPGSYSEWVALGLPVATGEMDFSKNEFQASQ